MYVLLTDKYLLTPVSSYVGISEINYFLYNFCTSRIFGTSFIDLLKFS